MLALVMCLVAAVSWGHGQSHCPKNTFPCYSGVIRCLRPQFLCDGREDCPRGDDELDSTCRHHGGCKPGTFHCDQRCWAGYRICDGHEDCSDGIDEANCKLPWQKLLTCTTGIGNDYHRSWAVVCDGRVDCPLGTDEKHCDSPDKCSPEAFFCDGSCKPNARWCDSYQDCNDGRDEALCNYTTSTTTSTTTSSTPTSTTAAPANGIMASMENNDDHLEGAVPDVSEGRDVNVDPPKDACRECSADSVVAHLVGGAVIGAVMGTVIGAVSAALAIVLYLCKKERQAGAYDVSQREKISCKIESGTEPELLMDPNMFQRTMDSSQAPEAEHVV